MTDLDPIEPTTIGPGLAANVGRPTAFGNPFRAYDAAIERIDELAERVRVVEGERDAARVEALHTEARLRGARLRAESAETKVERVKVLHEQWKAEGWDYAEGAIYDLSVALDECSCETDERAESAEAAREAEKAAHERLRAGLRQRVDDYDEETHSDDCGMGACVRCVVDEFVKLLLGGGGAR